MGLANQVGNAINQFVTNFQTAFQPQIIKNYACGNIDELFKLIFVTSKISFFLLFIIGCPVIFNINTLLGLWLTEIPEYTTTFCIYMIAIAMIEAIGAPFWMAIQAVGRIMKYQIIISLTLFMTIIISGIMYKFGFPPQISLVVKIFITAICLAVRLLFVHSLISFQITNFFFKVLIPILIISVIGCSVFVVISKMLVSNSILYLIISTLLFAIIISFSGWYILLLPSQRDYIKSLVMLKMSNSKMD